MEKQEDVAVYAEAKCVASGAAASGVDLSQPVHRRRGIPTGDGHI